MNLFYGTAVAIVAGCLMMEVIRRFAAVRREVSYWRERFERANYNEIRARSAIMTLSKSANHGMTLDQLLSDVQFAYHQAMEDCRQPLHGVRQCNFHGKGAAPPLDP
jgi:hypothetical protein